VKKVPDLRAELDAYVTAHPFHRGKPCWTCALPHAIKDALHYGREKGWTVNQLSRFLVDEKGYAEGDATSARLQYHFSRRHKP
jgi:hypothetical protein